MKIKTDSPLLEYTRTSSYAALQKITKAMCEHKSAQGNVGVTFSMFETSKNKDIVENEEWIVDHPDIWSDKPVFSGQVIFYSDYWRIADYQVESEIMANPRWCEIISEAGRQLIDPNDQSTACLFLEGFNVLDPRSDGVTFIELVWGS